MPHRDLAVLDAARRAADGVVALTDRPPRWLLHAAHLRGSAQAIGANIA